MKKAQIPGKICRHNRSGAIILLFMVSLAMLSMTAAAMVRVTLLQRSLVRSNELRIQSEWLFQSAVARASSRLQSDADYNGEDWKVAVESPGLTSDALAKISVDSANGKTNERQVTITVLYPPDGTERAMVTRAVSISL